MAKRNRQRADQTDSQADHHPTPEGPVTAAAVAEPPSNPVEQAFQNADAGPETGDGGNNAPRKYPPYRAIVTTPDFELREYRDEKPWRRAFLFAEKPPQEALDKLKEAHLQYDPYKKRWHVEANNTGRIATDQVAQQLIEVFGRGENRAASR